jgi:hypothetical protein
MTTRSADDFDTIGARLASLRRTERFAREHICAIQNGGQLSECWCHKAGPLGSNLPCPQNHGQDMYEGCGFIQKTWIDGEGNKQYKWESIWAAPMITDLPWSFS